MDVKLKVLAGTHTGKEIPLAGPKFLIGRAEDCHLRAGSELISRHHGEISVGDSYVGIRDLGSRNGILVNGEKIVAECELKAGDQLKIGPLEFEIVMHHRVGGPKRAPVKSVADVAKRTAEVPKQRSVEEDISQWLGDPETKSSGRWVSADTQSVKLTETSTIAGAAFLAATPPADEADEATADAGKLPKIEAPKAKDSREAAANILKMMSKRK